MKKYIPVLSNKSTDIIKTLAGKYHLKLVILFGGLAQGIYDDKCNIDLAIQPEDKSFYENDSLSKLTYDFTDEKDIERREVGASCPPPTPAGRGQLYRCSFPNVV